MRRSCDVALAMAEWKVAVASGNAGALADLVSSSSTSNEQALTILRSAAELVTLRLSSPATATSRLASTPIERETASTTTTASPPTMSTNGTATDKSSGPSAALLKLESVQLLQPRGRFDMEFHESCMTVTGKAGSATISWDQVRHIIRLPRPEGYSWGKMGTSDPAGSDLLAVPLKHPSPFRKSTVTLILVQPDPKAKRTDFSFILEGVSRHLSGSQGTVISEMLKALARVGLSEPERSLFFTKEGKSFVKCYHGVNGGSLFPLKEGLLFMKPGLFLPREDIAEVVCGRGGSAQTRYVDLVVGMEAYASHGGGGKDVRQEFSNIPREYLSSLQHYIEAALIAPRRRRAQNFGRAQHYENSGTTQVEAPGTQEAGTSGQQSVKLLSKKPPDALSVLPLAHAPSEEAARVTASGDGNEDEGFDSDESDEDFAPSERDSSSGDDSGGSGVPSDDDDDSNDGVDDQEEAEGEVTCSPKKEPERNERKRLPEIVEAVAKEDGVAIMKRGRERRDGEGEDTESEEDIRVRPRKCLK